MGMGLRGCGSGYGNRRDRFFAEGTGFLRSEQDYSLRPRIQRTMQSPRSGPCAHRAGGMKSDCAARSITRKVVFWGMLAALRGGRPRCRLIGAAMPRAPWPAATRLGNTTSSVSNSPRFATGPATAVGALNSCRQRDHIIGAVLLSLVLVPGRPGQVPFVDCRLWYRPSGARNGDPPPSRSPAPGTAPGRAPDQPSSRWMLVGMSGSGWRRTGSCRHSTMSRSSSCTGGASRREDRVGHVGVREGRGLGRKSTPKGPVGSGQTQTRVGTPGRPCIRNQYQRDCNRARKRIPCGCGQSVVHLLSLPFRGERGPCPGYLCLRGKFRRVATNQGGPMHDRNLTHTILFSISCGSESPAGRHRNLRLKTPPDHPATAPSPR